MRDKHLALATNPLGQLLLLVIVLDVFVDKRLLFRVQHKGRLGLGSVVRLDSLINGDISGKDSPDDLLQLI